MPVKKLVLSVNGFFPSTYGGGQVYVWRVAKELSRRGWEVTILSPGRHSRLARGGGGVEHRTFDDLEVTEYALDETTTTPLELYLHDGPHVRRLLTDILEKLEDQLNNCDAPALIRIDSIIDFVEL